MIRDFNRIMADYKPDDDIMCEDSRLMNRLKHIIFEDLDEIDRRVIILYAETSSQREMAKLLGVSASSVNLLIKAIRQKIKDRLKTEDRLYERNCDGDAGDSDVSGDNN